MLIPCGLERIGSIRAPSAFAARLSVPPPATLKLIVQLCDVSVLAVMIAARKLPATGAVKLSESVLTVIEPARAGEAGSSSRARRKASRWWFFTAKVERVAPRALVVRDLEAVLANPSGNARGAAR